MEQNEPKYFAWGGALVATVGVCAFLWWGVYYFTVTRLEQIAKGIDGTDPAIEAVKKLGKYRGGRPSEILFSLASGMYRSSLVGTEIRTEAVAALAEMRDPKAADQLARLLQPHQPYQVRLAVAQALARLQCERVCTEYILAYLERIHHGALNIEDRVLVEVTASDLKKSYAALQSDLYAILYGVLASSDHTASILREVYGISSAAPSDFALELLLKTVLQVCSDLGELRVIVDSYPERRSEMGRLSAVMKYQRCADKLAR